MEKDKKRWLMILGIVLLVGLILLALILGWFSRIGKAFDSRPLVLIHMPGFGEDFQVGDGVLVHATAREENGLERIELWVNDILIDTQLTGEEDSTNLSLLSSWTPTYEGKQQVVVRAFSSDGIPGQSTVQVDVSPADDLTYLVQEGDTMESIAEEYGTTADELSELNPGSEEGGLSAGDELELPGGEPGTEPGPLPDSGGEDPPEAEVGSPLAGFRLPFMYLLGDDPGDITLRLEVPGLRTGEAFDGLHCYVSLADSLPQWYPDQDNDQATDESFIAGEDGWWITEGTLVGESAPIISWPANQSLPLSIDCVGILGGSDAVTLGPIDLEIPPEDWDGTRKGYESDGDGGHLNLDLRLTQLAGDPRNTPKYPDSLLPKPYNVRVNEENNTLEWDFDAADEEQIDGFRIYLNGNLQWVEQEDARSSQLPPEWLRPPCAWTYTFGVTSYRIEYPDGPESDPPSEYDLTQPREGCHRIIRVNFLELETFDLGGDGRYERRHGDVGPAYGSFIANDVRVSFDHGREGRGLDMVEGLRHNTTYDLAEVSGDVGWHFDGDNSVIAEVPYEGELRVAFLITDRDTGRCNDSGDPGCDDQICRGEGIPISAAYGQLDGYHRETLTSDNDRCRLVYEYEPTEDSPVGERYLGAEPLPWLEVSGLDVYSDPDQTIVAVMNSGTASWPGRSLSLELQYRDGRSLGHFVFDDVDIPVGGYQTFFIPRTTVDPLIDVCVLVDSQDEVLELYERSGALVHQPFCTDLPDMEIEDVVYTDSDRTLRIMTRNSGEGPVGRWSLGVNITLASGEVMMENYQVPDLALPAGYRHTIEIPLAEEARPRMFGGYTVTLNRDRSFPESNYDNNSLTIPEGTDISLSWYGVNVPESLRNIVEYHINAYIKQGSVRKEQIVNWDLTQDINWGSCFEDDYCVLHFDGSHRRDYYTYGDRIYGDEDLELEVHIDHPGSLWTGFSTTEEYYAPGWGAGAYDPSSGACTFWPTREDEGRHGFRFTTGSGQVWTTRVDICRENFEE